MQQAPWMLKRPTHCLPFGAATVRLVNGTSVNGTVRAGRLEVSGKLHMVTDIGIYATHVFCFTCTYTSVARIVRCSVPQLAGAFPTQPLVSTHVVSYTRVI